MLGFSGCGGTVTSWLFCNTVFATLSYAENLGVSVLMVPRLALQSDPDMTTFLEKYQLKISFQS